MLLGRHRHDHQIRLTVATIYHAVPCPILTSELDWTSCTDDMLNFIVNTLSPPRQEREGSLQWHGKWREMNARRLPISLSDWKLIKLPEVEVSENERPKVQCHPIRSR